jgi:photosystem II stability/assembly factor-like uncharacterized protein
MDIFQILMRLHIPLGIGLLGALSRPALAQWTIQPVDSTIEFRGLSPVSPTVVWASGTRGRVARSTDGGRTWRIDTVTTDRRLDLRDIQAASDTHAWAISSGPAEQGQAHIFATSDGRHWSEQFAAHDSGAFFDAISFWDDRHGIVMGDPFQHVPDILLTSDGGRTWTRDGTRTAPPVIQGEGAFAASGTCLAVQGTTNAWIATGGGARARVFRTTDGGRNWQVSDTPVHAGNASSGNFSIAFVDARHGIVVGGDYAKPKEPFDNVALSDDGGVTWRRPRGPLPQGYMSSVAYIPGTSGRSLVAVGLAGTARSDDGGESWTMIDSVPYNSVAFASHDAGWAVGPRGRIARWTPTAHGPDRP